MNEQLHSKRAGEHNSQARTHRHTGIFAALSSPLQRAIEKQGYEVPTPIQEQAIPPALSGRDILGSAQTGTGKTAAFVLPLLQRLAENAEHVKTKKPRALIIAPTRELAAQIGDSIQNYGHFMSLSHVVIFGGVSQNPQVKKLKKGVDILVATPGRLLDLMQQGFIALDAIEYFVLDEVDRMLDMGFIPDIKRILTHVPKKRQTLFFSATLTKEMRKLAHTMVYKPVTVMVEHESLAVERINQKVLFVKKEDKKDVLFSVLNDTSVFKALVFTQMKHTANRVVKTLKKAGIRGEAIHGNKSQAARTRALKDFKKGKYHVLVATDVAARGLDIDDITHVVNYDLPVEAETYVHRIGRTARAGADGEAISLCTAEDRGFLTDIEKLLGVTVPQDISHEHHCEVAYAADKKAKPFKKQGNRSSRGRRRNRRFRGKK